VQKIVLSYLALVADDYTDNPDPGQDPVQGARICASYSEPVSSLGGAIQDSEDEEEPPRQRGKCHYWQLSCA